MKKIGFIVVLMFVLNVIPIQAPDETATSGNMFITSSSPVFIDWFNSTNLLDDQESVVFYAQIYDGDTDGTNITLTIFYSDDGFVTDNQSINIPYESTLIPDFYYYKYEFPGQEGGTYYNYYYTADDNTTTNRKPITGVYFDIQWSGGKVGGSPSSDIPPDPDGNPNGKTPLTAFAVNTVVIVTAAILILFFFFYAKKKANKKLSKR